VPKLVPLDPEPAPEPTLIGHLPMTRAPAPALVAPRRPTGTPQIEVPQLPSRNLREAYPAIHRPLPSPMRPSSAFDDRRASSEGIGEVFDMSRVVRRDAIVRRVAVVLGLVVAIIVAALIATRW
jgi:hypothetical protein